jgi:hypothetical protein
MILLIKNVLLVVTASLLVTSCAVNTASSAPEKNKFVHIEDTPAYVLIESDKSVDLINDHIYICLAEVEGKARNIRTPMKVFGGFYGLAGLAGVIDLATTGGVISSILLPGMVVITAAGWVTYASADGVAELSEYKNLENCLEDKGYSVVFFFEEES